MTDFRAELQLLFDAAESFTEPALGHHSPWAAALDRARAALAEQPVGEGPLKERPDFIAGYREGLADRRRIIEHEEAERPANALAEQPVVPLDKLDRLIALDRDDPANALDEQPVGPTDEELEDFALQNGGGYFNCDCQEEADILTRKHVSNYRAVLARWGTSNLAEVRSSLGDHQLLVEDDVDLYLEQ
jgi:hypothetical protein